MTKKIIISLGSVLAAAALFGGEFEANGCKVKWDGRTVAVGNALFSKRYICIDGRLQTTSFKAAAGTEWQSEKFDESKDRRIAVIAEKAQWTPAGVEGVRVEVCCESFTNTLYLFAGMPGVISICPPRDNPASEHDLERDFRRIREWNKSLLTAVARNDRISYGLRHVKVTSCVCADQTDIRDQLLQADERLLMNYDWPYTLAATSLDCRDVLSGEGIVFVRIAPMPVSRPGKEDDFVVDGAKRPRVRRACAQGPFSLFVRFGQAQNGF